MHLSRLDDPKHFIHIKESISQMATAILVNTPCIKEVSWHGMAHFRKGRCTFLPWFSALSCEEFPAYLSPWAMPRHHWGKY